MSQKYLTITPRDPVIARDSRPFGAGVRMKSLEWPYPSVVAGSIRTAIGSMIDNGTFKDDTVKNLKKIRISGPFPVVENRLYFPAPQDLLIDGTDPKTPVTYSIRPQNPGSGMQGGCDLPYPNLQPALLSSLAEHEFKPLDPAPFWSISCMEKWLANPGNIPFTAPILPKENETIPSYLLPYPKKESRIHVQIDPKLGSAADGMLYETIGLDFSRKGEREPVRISTRLETEDGGIFDEVVSRVNGIHTFGGERRVAAMECGSDAPNGWKCPEAVKTALNKKTKVRMVLATPAYFSQGWLPSWIDGATLKGKLTCDPSLPDPIELTLVSACVARWKPVSGWNMEKDGPHKTGPKPLRRLVPAGSVYFFECQNAGDAQRLAEKCWLRSVSDELEDTHERSDGFGLALWGAWDYERNNTISEKKEV
ncbi:MAG: type III-B CRISPR module-associated protein Cmr3 [Methanoregula sp.]|nr:type III-B CRISPR module-associated protein Cmr3 [Methanoregula sp.]